MCEALRRLFFDILQWDWKREERLNMPELTCRSRPQKGARKEFTFSVLLAWPCGQVIMASCSRLCFPSYVFVRFVVSGDEAHVSR